MSNKFLQKRSKPVIIAHRGDNRNAPENTISAFDLARQYGADAIEFDVQLSRDQLLVVMHDRSLNRTTNGRGLVRRRTLQQIQKLKIEQTEHVPTLEEVFKKFATNSLMVIETKNYTTPWDGLENVVAAEVAKKGLTEQIMFGSFIPWAGAKLKKTLPDATFCWFCFGNATWLAWPWRRSIDVYGLHISLGVTATLERLIKKKYSVNSWIINDASDITHLAKLGVTMITTDDTKLAIATLKNN